ncbi:hypothetical protein [Streptomyces sp. NPDC058861]|uniref:hypothetical protein n=1 Tax=Streptomyces sp. NPDC058861 TaxID=3346653 RepID=UPI003676EACB
MIPALHRMKGAALVLGASRPGQNGPFGLYGSDTGDEYDQESVEQAGDGLGR